MQKRLTKRAKISREVNGRIDVGRYRKTKRQNKKIAGADPDPPGKKPWTSILISVSNFLDFFLNDFLKTLLLQNKKLIQKLIYVYALFFILEETTSKLGIPLSDAISTFIFDHILYKFANHS